MRNIISSLVLASAILASSRAGADDDTITSKAARVSIKVPAGWKSKTEGEALTLTDKKEDTAVSFVLIEAGDLKSASKRLGKYLEKKVDNLTWKKEEKVEINGMKGVALDGDGSVGGKNVDLAVVILDTPNPDKDLFVVAVAEDEVLAQHKDEVKFVFKNLKPVK